MAIQTSKIPAFFEHKHVDRLRILQEHAALSEEDSNFLKMYASTNFVLSDSMIENVVSSIFLPLGMATNFLINGENYIIPMVTEESSVVAAACNGAKLARYSGGFLASSSLPMMVGQIQILGISDYVLAEKSVHYHKDDILALANKYDEILVSKGGGAVDLKTKVLQTDRGSMFIVHLIVNVADAFGANIVNTMIEGISKLLETITNGYARLRIVSNYGIGRIVKVRAVWNKEIIGEHVVESILDADAFACADYYRAVTHNKGIMNGIDAVVLATGNDCRAVEAAAHSYACRNGSYQPLSRYYKNVSGDLVGELEIPLSVGIIGGITQSHPITRICLKMLRVKTSCHLAEIIGSVGLAQNFAALNALVQNGIQKGHMRLHNKKIKSIVV